MCVVHAFYVIHCRNPTGTVKRAIKINIEEFKKGKFVVYNYVNNSQYTIPGAKILGERAGYRLLTPLSTFQYASYLHKATQDYLKYIPYFSINSYLKHIYTVMELENWALQER